MVETMVEDPVCGMRIDPDDAAGNAEHEGKRYYFCSQTCYDAFVADLLLEESVSAEDPRAAYLLLPQAMGGDVEAIAAALRGDGAEQVSAGALLAVQVPVLLLNGRDDPASLATGRLLEVLPNSRAAVCEGDHLSAPWQPSFQKTVAEFMQAQWAKRGGLA